MDYRSYRLNRKGGSFKKPKLLQCPDSIKTLLLLLFGLLMLLLEQMCLILHKMCCP